MKKLGNYMIELIQFGSFLDEAQAHALALAETLDSLHLAIQQLQRHRRTVDGLRRSVASP